MHTNFASCCCASYFLRHTCITHISHACHAYDIRWVRHVTHVNKSCRHTYLCFAHRSWAQSSDSFTCMARLLTWLIYICHISIHMRHTHRSWVQSSESLTCVPYVLIWHIHKCDVLFICVTPTTAERTLVTALHAYHMCAHDSSIYVICFIHMCHTYRSWTEFSTASHVCYGVATISKLLKIIGLFCRISSLS